MSYFKKVTMSEGAFGNRKLVIVTEGAVWKTESGEARFVDHSDSWGNWMMLQ